MKYGLVVTVAAVVHRLAHHLQHFGIFGGLLETFPHCETGLATLPYLSALRDTN